METEAGDAFAALFGLFTLFGTSCLCLLPPALVLLIAWVMSRDTNRRVAALERQVAALNVQLAMPVAQPPAPVDWPEAADYPPPSTGEGP